MRPLQFVAIMVFVLASCTIRNDSAAELPDIIAVPQQTANSLLIVAHCRSTSNIMEPSQVVTALWKDGFVVWADRTKSGKPMYCAAWLDPASVTHLERKLGDFSLWDLKEIELARPSGAYDEIIIYTDVSQARFVWDESPWTVDRTPQLAEFTRAWTGVRRFLDQLRPPGAVQLQTDEKARQRFLVAFPGFVLE